MSANSLLSIEEAAQCLQEGEIIAYPTEAVYGLGCDPRNESAVMRLLALKERPAEAGLILIADQVERFSPFIQPMDEELQARALSAWPGPVTWLVPRAPAVPAWLAGNHPTIALRIPDHPVCSSLCRAFGGAIISTSANPRAAEPARSAVRVDEYFGSELCGIVGGELGSGENPSEIRDLLTGEVLRKG